METLTASAKQRQSARASVKKGKRAKREDDGERGGEENKQPTSQRQQAEKPTRKQGREETERGGKKEGGAKEAT
jgi:hypothetical protein